MADRYQLSIVIPVFNEAENLAPLIRQIIALRLPSAEIVVVDDGSTDGSAEAAIAAGANVARHPYNIGNGAAIKTGIRTARGRLLVFMDGDGQHKPEDIPKLLAEADRYHMVVGARAKGSKLRLHRYAANALYNLLACYVTQFSVKELTSGFRVLARLDALRFIDLFTRVGQAAYFVNDDLTGQSDETWWRSDGTTAGTMPLADFGATGHLSAIIDVGGKAFAFGQISSGRYFLIVSDGTVGSTQYIHEFSSSIDANQMLAWNGLLYFVEADQLWVSDGSTNGTTSLGPFLPADPPSSAITWVTGLGNQVFFTAGGGETGT